MVRRLISDRMSYRNHYMCSGEAISLLLNVNECVSCFICSLTPTAEIKVKEFRGLVVMVCVRMVV